MLWEDKTIPPHVWEELNHRYRVDVWRDDSGCTKYRVFNKLTQQAEIETYVQREPLEFYKQKAQEIEDTIERTLLGE